MRAAVSYNMGRMQNQRPFECNLENGNSSTVSMKPLCTRHNSAARKQTCKEPLLFQLVESLGQLVQLRRRGL